MIAVVAVAVAAVLAETVVGDKTVVAAAVAVAPHYHRDYYVLHFDGCCW